MQEEIKIHHYEEGTISLEVPFDGETYINATEAAKAWNKRPETWLKTNHTKDYISALKSVLPEIELVIVQNGGTTPGTWLHPKLAIAFSRWLDPKFAVWCDQKIENLLQTGKATATVEERTMWADKLPILYKALTKKGYWGPKFSEVVTEMENEAVSIRAQQKFIVKCSKKVMTNDRLSMYKRMISYYNELMKSGAIERRTWEDMTFYLFTRIGEIQTKRSNKGNKELEKLAAENKALRDKYAAVVNAEENPPISIKDLVLASEDDVKRVANKITASDGMTLLFKGFLDLHPQSGQISPKGKIPPTYTSNLSSFNPFNLVVWLNDNDTAFVRSERFTSVLEFQCVTKNNLFFGVHAKSVGIRYFCIINPDTLATIIYKHIIKGI